LQRREHIQAVLLATKELEVLGNFWKFVTMMNWGRFCRNAFYHALNRAGLKTSHFKLIPNKDGVFFWGKKGCCGVKMAVVRNLSK